MRGNAGDLDRILDQAIEGISNAKMDPSTEQAVADRVWSQLSDARAAAETDRQIIRDCSGFQAIIPAYLRGELSETKALLVKDHVSGCVPCRRALKQVTSGSSFRRSAAPARTTSSWVSRLGWRAAAAAVIFIALVGLSFQTDGFAIETGGLIRVESVNGEAFRVTPDGNVPLQVGDEISFKEASGIRTAKASSATFRLSDNSLVEMSERAELAVTERRALLGFGRHDSLVKLDRGNIIVDAADREKGQLLVDTGECRVEGAGATLAVNHGIKGSRISAIRGEVALAHNGRTVVLQAGEQSTTRPGLRRVPVEDDIAWSDNLNRHLELLREVTRVTQEIVEDFEGPALRYSTDLLDVAPPNTVVYVGIPNLSGSLSQAYEMLQEKIADNELLRKWWNESVVDSGTDVELRRVMDRIRDYGEHLGDEIAVTLQLDADGEVDGPLVLSRLRHPADFRAFVEDDLEQLATEGLDAPIVRIFEGQLPQPAATPRSDDDEMSLWIHDGYLAVAPGVERLRQFARVLQPNGRSFVSGSFHPRLADLYDEGVEWVVGVDVESIIAAADASPDESLERLGLLDLQHVIAVRKSDEGMKQNLVTLTFDQPRQGLASWLAEPAPIGSLDFISPQANFAAAFVMQEPSAVVEQLFSFLAADDSDFEERLAQFERENGIDFRRDVADTLGGEFAVALDGPVLPKPSWKLVMEVYDPDRLQQTLRWVVDQINGLAQEAGKQGFVLKEQAQGKRLFYEIRSLDAGISAHYTFADGYLIASASRALINRSLATRKSGVNLPRTPQFTSLLPHDGKVNFSAVVYHDLGSILGPLSKTLASPPVQLPDEQMTLIHQLGSASLPSLTLAYGEEDRITFVNRSQGGFLGSALRSLLRLDSLVDVQQLLDEATRGGGAGATEAGVTEKTNQG